MNPLKSGLHQQGSPTAGPPFPGFSARSRRGVEGSALIEELKDELLRVCLNFNTDGAGAPPVGVEVYIGQGLVDRGKDLPGFRIGIAEMKGPSLGKLAKTVEAGRRQLDFDRSFRRWREMGQKRPQSLGTGPGTGLSLFRIVSSDGRRGTGPPQSNRQGFRATVPMKVLP